MPPPDAGFALDDEGDDDRDNECVDGDRLGERRTDDHRGSDVAGRLGIAPDGVHRAADSHADAQTRPEAASGRAVPHVVAPRRDGDAAITVADPAQAAQRLGWRTRRDLAAMCRDGWAWQSSNPNGYGI